MKLINSLISPGILKNNIKRYYLIALAYFIFLFTALPIYFYANGGEWAKTQQTVGRTYNSMLRTLEFSDMGIFILFITCALSFVVALIINRYLNAQNSTIFNHSLPVGKTKLFITNFVTAKCIIILPLAIIALILILGKYILGWVTYRTLHVLIWFIVSAICTMFIYTLTTFISMLTGSTMFAGVLSAALLSLEYPIAYLLLGTRTLFVKGAFFEQTSLEPFSNITAVIRFATFSSKPMTLVEGIVYLLITIGLFFAGLYVYRARKNEKATETIAFDILKPIFKYIVTFLACLSVGIVFMFITNYSIIGTFLGYILGITLGYYISEMVIQKSIFVFKDYKGYLVSIAIFFILVLCIKFDVMGYESKVPALEDIESANFRDSYVAYEYVYDEDGNRESKLVDLNTHVTELESIEKIRELHKDLTVTSFSQFERERMYMRTEGIYYHDSKYLSYKLKNGKTFVRCFEYDVLDNYDSLKAVYEDDNYQYATHKDTFEYAKDEFNRLEISNNQLHTRIDILDNAKVDELLVELEKDVKNKTYDINYESSQLIITLYTIDKYSYDRFKINNPGLTDRQLRDRTERNCDEIFINSECINTINWLKANGYYNSLVVNASNAEEIVIFKNYDFKLNEYATEKYYYDNYPSVATVEAESVENNSVDELLLNVKESGKAISVVNDYQIQNIMLDAVYDSNAEYCVIYKLNGANIDSKYYEHISYNDDYKEIYVTSITYLYEEDLPEELSITLNK